LKNVEGESSTFFNFCKLHPELILPMFSKTYQAFVFTHLTCHKSNTKFETVTVISTDDITHPVATQTEPTPFQRLEALAHQVMSVPKAEID